MFALTALAAYVGVQERGSGESKISSRLKLATGCVKMRGARRCIFEPQGVELVLSPGPRRYRK